MAVTSSARPDTGVHLQLFLVAIIWAGQFVAGKVVAPLAPPFVAGSLRFVAACVALVALARIVDGGLPRPAPHHGWRLVVLAITGVAGWNYCFFAALETITAGRAALIMALTPIATAVGATLFFGERRTMAGWAGIAVALAGAWIVITRGDPGTTLAGAFGRGELLMLGCMFGWSAYSLVGRALFREMSPLAVSTWSALVGTAMLFVGAATELPTAGPITLGGAGWAGVLYLGVLGTALNFYWFNRGVQRLGPARAAIYINLVPVFAVLYGTLFLDEPLLASMVIGGALVLAGVVMVNRR